MLFVKIIYSCFINVFVSYILEVPLKVPSILTRSSFFQIHSLAISSVCVLVIMLIILNAAVGQFL
jgi:hypothetical protein